MWVSLFLLILYTDQQMYLEHDEEVPFVKQPIGEVPPLGSLRRGTFAFELFIIRYILISCFNPPG